MNRLINELRKPASAPRAKKTRLAVEQLEDRLVPAIAFAQYGNNGIWAWDTNKSGQMRQIASSGPTVMDQGADGTLYAAFANSGTWRYNYWSNSWSEIGFGTVVDTMSAASDNTLFATVNGWGTFEYDATGWHQLATADAYHLAAVRDNFFYGDFNNITYRYRDGNWTQLITSGITTYVMDASSNGTLYIGYGNNVGTWRYNNGWTKMHDWGAIQIAAGVADRSGYNSVYFNFGSAQGRTGVWNYNSSGYWSQLTTQDAWDITVVGDTLIATFWNGGTWQKPYTTGWVQVTGATAWQLA